MTVVAWLDLQCSFLQQSHELVPLKESNRHMCVTWRSIEKLMLLSVM